MTAFGAIYFDLALFDLFGNCFAEICSFFAMSGNMSATSWLLEPPATPKPKFAPDNVNFAKFGPRSAPDNVHVVICYLSVGTLAGPPDYEDADELTIQ